MRRNIINSVVAGLLMIAANRSYSVDIVGHRGASYDRPENTLSSFKLGYQQAADACELDIHLTKDGKIIVIHDFDTGRVSGGAKTKVVDQTLAELRKLEVGKFAQWSDKGISEKLPTLDEVLPLIPDGHRLFIEIKCGPEILPELEKSLQRAGKKPAQTVIIGFGYETMLQAKAKFPNLEVSWLVSSDSKAKKFPDVDELIQKAKAAKIDGLDLNSGFPIDADFVKKVHAAGLKLYTWTVDDSVVARKEMEAGVDGITTNRPGWLREQLALKP